MNMLFLFHELRGRPMGPDRRPSEKKEIVRMKIIRHVIVILAIAVRIPSTSYSSLTRAFLAGSGTMAKALLVVT